MTKARVDPNLLRSISLFGRRVGGSSAELAAAASLRTAASRTILFAEGSRVENLFILTRGAAELFSERDERRFTIYVARGARSLSVSSILAERHPLSARILEPSELLAVPAKLVLELIGRDASLADAMVRELAAELLQIIEDFKNHRLLNTTARIAHWMLHRDRETGERRTNRHPVRQARARVLSRHDAGAAFARLLHARVGRRHRGRPLGHDREPRGADESCAAGSVIDPPGRPDAEPARGRVLGLGGHHFSASVATTYWAE